MTRKLLSFVAVAIIASSCTSSGSSDEPDTPKSKWISQIVEYRPAPGQFINTTLGSLDAAQGIVGKRGLVSLGGFGGYIVFRFDHAVKNIDGVDFVIHGNAFEGNSEAGIVMVAVDKNGNGKPDADEWYELKGAMQSDSRTIIDYQINYTRPTLADKVEDIKWYDNKSGTGTYAVAMTAPFHSQSYYPQFLADKPTILTFTGTKLPNLAKKGNLEGEEIWVNPSAGEGYADTFSESYMLTVQGDNDTQRANKFDISNAIDATGKSIHLTSIDFIKVYTAHNQQSGHIGEVSTEVCGAISLTAIKK